MAPRMFIVFCLFLLWNVNGYTLPHPTRHACIIGAGYSGLSASRYMKQYGVNFTVFEATKYVGGTWRFDPRVGTDEDGVPIFSSMYKYLRTNTPRQTMEYTGFPLPEGTPSYPSATCFYKYLRLFTKHFDLKKHIQFRSYVQSVDWVKDRDNWELVYQDTESKELRTAECDFVVVANGQYLKPLVPKFEGLENFKGKVIHSHDYKEPEAYKNRRVLLVGAGPSGLDLAIHLANVTSKLYHSHHLSYNQPFFSKSYVKKSDISSFTKDGAVFNDGSFEEVDDVIMCTGYDFAFPFLGKNAGVTSSGKFVLPLHQQMVNIKHPSMVFIGVAKKIINKVMEAQTEYAAALAAGKFKLPSQEQMLQMWLDHVHTIHNRGVKVVDVNVVGDAMDQYFANMTQEAGVHRMAPVITKIRDFNAVNRLEDLINYRDYDYNIVDDFSYGRRYNYREGFPCPVQDVDL